MVTARAVTLEDVEHLHDEQRYDLIRGRLIAMSPASYRHGRIANGMNRRLGNYAVEHGGVALAAETGFILARDPDTLLGPDASYLRPERATPDLPDDGYLPIAPDLAVEVLSPSNTRAEMAEKVDAYLAGGTALVWVVDPVRKLVTVYAPGRTSRILGEGETLDGGDVLPGFSAAVSDIFA